MAINLSQAFNRTAPAPIDGSLVLSKAAMLAVNDNLMPEKYFTICTDDGQIYTYDKNATPNAQTGKFSPYSGGGTGVPIGAIVGMSGGTTVPNGFLKANGQIVNIADYPYLAQYYEDNFGAANHFGGDGTTTFAVEDVQGEFLRGTGTNSHANQGSGAAAGTHQDATVLNGSMMQPSAGRVSIRKDASDDWQNLFQKPDAKYQTTSYVELVSTKSIGTYTDTQGKFSTRPTNTSVLWVVCASKPANTTTEYEGGTGIEVNGNVISNTLYNYSITEKAVGTDTDGSTIYQKTIEINNSITIPANDKIDTILLQHTTNIKYKLIYGIGNFSLNNNYAIPIPYANNNSGAQYTVYLYSSSDGDIGLGINNRLGNNSITLHDFKVNIIYTKITA